MIKLKPLKIKYMVPINSNPVIYVPLRPKLSMMDGNFDIFHLPQITKIQLEPLRVVYRYKCDERINDLLNKSTYRQRESFERENRMQFERSFKDFKWYYRKMFVLYLPPNSDIAK